MNFLVGAKRCFAPVGATKGVVSGLHRPATFEKAAKAFNLLGVLCSPLVLPDIPFPPPFRAQSPPALPGRPLSA